MPTAPPWETEVRLCGSTGRELGACLHPRAHTLRITYRWQSTTFPADVLGEGQCQFHNLGTPSRHRPGGARRCACTLWGSQVHGQRRSEAACAFAERSTAPRASVAGGRHFCRRLQSAPQGSAPPFLTSLSLRSVVLPWEVNCLPVIVSRSLSVSSLCLRTKGVRGRISTNATHTHTPLLLVCLQNRLVFPWHCPSEGMGLKQACPDGCLGLYACRHYCVWPY